VEGHDHDRGAVALAQAGVGLELLDTFLHRDGVDDALALDALEAGLDDLPLGGVEHDRHPGDVGLTGDQIEEGHHGLLRIQHALVHVDIDDLSAGLYLLQRHFQRFGVILLADQPGEPGRARDVGALADVDEQGVAIDGEGLEPGQAAGPWDIGDLPGSDVLHRFGDGADMLGGGAAAATDDIHEAGPGKLGDQFRGLGGAFVILAERIGQTGVGVGGDIGVGLVGQLLQIGTQLAGTQRAVQAHGDRLGGAGEVPEGLGGLAGRGRAGGVGDGAGDHDRQLHTQFLEHALNGKDGGLGVKGVEDGFDHDQIGATLDQAAGGFTVVVYQLIEGDVAVAGVVDVRGQGAGAAGRREYAGYETRLVRGFGGLFVTDPPGEAGTFVVQLVGQVFHAVVGLGYPGGVEGVGFDDVGAGVEIGPFDTGNHL